MVLSDELWHEDSEAGITSQGSHLSGNMVRGLLSVSKSNGNVTVGRSSSLSPDNNGSSWQRWKLACCNLVFGILSTVLKLISSHVSGGTIQESSTHRVNSISNGSVALSNSVSGLSNRSSLGSEQVSVGGGSDEVHETEGWELVLVFWIVWSHVKILKSQHTLTFVSS